MQEAIDLRDATADGVAQGYAEAMVASKSWKVAGGRMRRPWGNAPEPKGLTGAALEAAVAGLALQFPDQVRVH